MLAGNVMQRQQFADLFFSRVPFLEEIIRDNFDAPSLTYPVVFNMKDSGRAFESTTGVTGFGLFSEQASGEQTEYDKKLQGYERRYTHSRFSKGYQIDEETMEDDFDGAIVDSAPALARSAQTSIETFVWRVFNNGFTSELGPDGVPLFSAAHPLVGGGTFDNLIAGDFAVATLESAINVFDDMRDDRNLLLETSPDILLYAPPLRWIVHEVLRSELRSDTADNATNAFNQIGLRTQMVKYLTNPTDWFIGMPKSRTAYRVYWRVQPQTSHTLDFDTGNAKTRMRYRLSAGSSDWRGWVGAQGS